MIASIPSPPVNGWQIGPFFLHFYALCLITGMIAAWAIGLRRWSRRGGNPEVFEDIVLWAIPTGIVGARFYHVLTHLNDYFAPGVNPLTVLYIWEGGIAIYGAISFGAAAVLVLARRWGVRFGALADALAPGIAVGQAIGRLGNWFNQELYGWPTNLPWALEIDPGHRASGYENDATFHPTFAYEAIWDLSVAGVLLLLDRRFALGRGKLFTLYIALYTLGRVGTEHIRLDYSYPFFGPIRFNEFVAGVISLVAWATFVWMLRNRPGRSQTVYLHDVEDADIEPAAEAADADDDRRASGAAETPKRAIVVPLPRTKKKLSRSRPRRATNSSLRATHRTTARLRPRTLGSGSKPLSPQVVVSHRKRVGVTRRRKPSWTALRIVNRAKKAGKTGVRVTRKLTAARRRPM